MKLDTLRFDDNGWHRDKREIADEKACQLVLVFGDSDMLKIEGPFREIRARYPNACIVGASSSGNILGAEISRCQIVATAVLFEKGSVRMSSVDAPAGSDTSVLGAEVVSRLPAEGLKHVFVLSDGLSLNGSELVKGINAAARCVPVTGGMAGDGDRFRETWIIADRPACQRGVVALGFYGEDLAVSTGCHGGWSPFGAERLVTRSVGNVLFELDNAPALDLYKNYLGEFAKDLPHSGMRFPLSILAPGESNAVIRTLLGIDEAAQSITFAGDIPEGSAARLMKPNFEQLVDGAGNAAADILAANDRRALGLVVSCVGRRVVMKQIVEEELHAIEQILGDNVHLTGFYSYGEFAPFRDMPARCQLHNQTMTLTAIYER